MGKNRRKKNISQFTCRTIQYSVWASEWESAWYDGSYYAAAFVILWRSALSSNGMVLWSLDVCCLLFFTSQFPCLFENFFSHSCCSALLCSAFVIFHSSSYFSVHVRCRFHFMSATKYDVTTALQQKQEKTVLLTSTVCDYDYTYIYSTVKECARVSKAKCNMY